MIQHNALIQQAGVTALITIGLVATVYVLTAILYGLIKRIGSKTTKQKEV